MKKLWIAFMVLATLGSIYPFDFQAPELNAATIDEFLRSCCVMLSRGDILGNIILFVPIGFTGLFATRTESSIRRRILFVCVIGIVVAFALQVMQIFLPSRDANLQDVAWNLVGIFAGAVLARIVGAFSAPTETEKADTSLVPLTLVATWLIYRLIPFVPSIDLQLFKDSLKPLLDFQLAPVSILHDATAWIIAGYLLRNARRDIRLDTYLLVLMFSVLCLEVVIVDNTIDFSNVLGAMLAAIIWHGVLSKSRNQEPVLVFLLVCVLVVTGLAPFAIRPDFAPFNWLPFRGFLGGSMYINAQSAAEKVFLYGSLVYLLWRTRISTLSGILIGFSLVALIEIAQTRFVGHTPEITDPLLLVFGAMALVLLELHQSEVTEAGQAETSSWGGATKSAANPEPRFKSQHEKWTSQSVNLRRYQFDFINNLSREMGVSASRAVRRIVATFIDGLERDDVIKPQRNPSFVESETEGERWVTLSVNLRKDQFDFLVDLSREMRVSVSRVIRRIIEQFIEGLERDDDHG